MCPIRAWRSGGTVNEPPVFALVTNDSIVYDNVISGLGDATLYGTEDPRLAYDPKTELYVSLDHNHVLVCVCVADDWGL